MSNEEVQSPPAAPATSRVLHQVADQLRAGRHPVVSGAIGDAVLVKGQPMSLRHGLELLGRGTFDVVVVIDAADGFQVVHGADQAAGLLAEAQEPDDQLPARAQRLREIRRLAGPSGTPDPIVQLRRLLAQREASVLAILDQAEIVLQDPAHHGDLDRERVARLQLALRDAALVGAYRNTCVLVATDFGRLPSVLVAGVENAGPVVMASPTRAERAAHLRTLVPGMYGTADLDAEALGRLADELALLTEGEPLLTLESLASFSAKGRHSVAQPRELVRRLRLGDQPDHWSHLRSDLRACRARLAGRVFGQPAAIDALLGVLASASLGLTMSSERGGAEGAPKGICWFVGPTGVGKTELAKALAEAVFGDSEAYVRFDLSTFVEEHSGDRLLGAPPGYVGHEQGGELTEAVRRRPNSVLLLDEVEKAHPRVLERLMSVLDDGRVADARGRITYFGDTIVVATANIGARELAELIAREGPEVSYDRIRAVSVDAVEHHFKALGRPEIFGRIGGDRGVVSFDILRPAVIEQITAKLVGATTLQNGPTLVIDLPSTTAMVHRAMTDPRQRALGGRQIRNILRDRAHQAARWIAIGGHDDAGEVRIFFDGADRLFAAVDGASPAPVA